MENRQSPNSQSSSMFGQLKDSIRDMVSLQRDYQLPDELFWEAFNNRVLLNAPLDLNQYTGLLVRH